MLNLHRDALRATRPFPATTCLVKEFAARSIHDADLDDCQSCYSVSHEMQSDDGIQNQVLLYFAALHSSELETRWRWDSHSLDCEVRYVSLELYSNRDVFSRDNRRCTVWAVIAEDRRYDDQLSVVTTIGSTTAERALKSIVGRLAAEHCDCGTEVTE